MDQDNFKLGVQAANAGDYEKAQAYFIRYVQSNPHSEQGWLYLGHCLSDSAKRIDCYKRVLRINPSNAEAQRFLSALTQPAYSADPYPSPHEEPQKPVRSVEQAQPAAPVRTAKPKKRSSNMIGWIIGAVAGVVVCLGVLCYGISKLPASPPPPTVTPTQALPKLDATLLPAPVTSAGAGKVCLGFWDRGIACLNETGWQTYTLENSELPTNNISTGVFCPDGRLAIAHADGVSLIRDGQWEHLPKLPDGYSKANDLACTSEGQLWASHNKGVSRYVNGAWQTYDIGMLTTNTTDSQTVLKVLAAPDGRIWVQTLHSVAVFANEQWTVFAKGQGLLNDPLELTLDFSGHAWVLFGNGVGSYDNVNWMQFQSVSPPFSTPESIRMDARGWLWTSSIDEGVAVFNGSTWSNFSKNTSSLSSDSINQMATDSLGRVWVATSYGLSVYDGSQWQTYRMDNSDLMDNRISFVEVERDGPLMPPPTDKARGSLIGVLGFENGDTLPQKRVELCASPLGSNFLGATPCDGQPFHMLAKTDQDGVFIFENVPTGYYWMVAETNNGWVGLDDEEEFPNNQILILPGEQYDIGMLVFVN